MSLAMALCMLKLLSFVKILFVEPFFKIIFDKYNTRMVFITSTIFDTISVVEVSGSISSLIFFDAIPVAHLTIFT